MSNKIDKLYHCDVGQARLEVLLATWQERLKLDAWKIRIRFAYTEELGDDRLATHTRSMTKKMG